MVFESRQYKIYQGDERLRGVPTTLYEKACIRSEKILPVNPDKKTAKTLSESIDFCHLNITAKQSYSFSLLFILLTFLPIALLTMLNFADIHILSFGYGMLGLFMLLMLSYFVYTYPMHLRSRYEMEVGSDIITLIIYITVYMRNTPNLENALRFASEHINGPIAFETRKIIWDIETGRYRNVQEALLEYSKKWQKNREFVESIEMIITSMDQPQAQRLTMLNESVDVILDGNRDNSRKFNQALRTPVLVVHAMGIILPILGLVMFPLVSVFLGVGAVALFVGYDIVLPVVLFLVISRIIDSRPSTFSKIDISENPDLAAEGTFRYAGRDTPAMPFALAVAILLVGIGLFLRSGDSDGIIPAVVIIAGITGGLATYYYLLSYQKVGLSEKTRNVEEEFTEAMFQIGNQAYTGIPIESSLEYSLNRIKNLKIKDFFGTAVRNMRTGMTFEQSFFDKKNGAIKDFPSKLIKTVMLVIVEASKRGSKTASAAMLSISKYLKDLHKTQEDIKDQLSEAISSMKFQLYFMSPLISAIVTTLTVLILRILSQISSQLGALGSVSLPFVSEVGSTGITAFQFILVVGIYLIETCIILSYFVNGIENGKDDVAYRSMASSSLVIGFIVFILRVINRTQKMVGMFFIILCFMY